MFKNVSVFLDFDVVFSNGYFYGKPSFIICFHRVITTANNQLIIYINKGITERNRCIAVEANNGSTLGPGSIFCPVFSLRVFFIANDIGVIGLSVSDITRNVI